jgi:isoleucyl-tRNA synthetase
MNYKKTLNLGKTDFKTHINLNQKEKEIKNFWLKINLSEKLLIKNKNKKTFIIHDGPLYANGDIHLGHALNRILKDIILRFYTFNKYYCPFYSGWDTHGLPIENKVIDNLNKDQIKLKFNQNQDLIFFRNLCKKYVFKTVNLQIKQLSKLGLLSNFENKYLTLDNDYQILQLKLLKKLWKQKLIYRDLKPIYWSPISHSALAEAEIEYIYKKSNSIYFTFNFFDKEENSFLSNTKMIVWTTTPWTIVANQFLSIKKDAEYILVNFNQEKYILAQSRLNSILEILEIKDYNIEKTFLGKEIINKTCKHPFLNKFILIVDDENVSLKEGTGIVHIAPEFGEEDFLLAKKLQAKFVSIIDKSGFFTESVADKEFVNKFYEDANQLTIDKLKENNNLLYHRFINHKFPHDWRHKQPVIRRLTWQWFINISSFKEKTIDNINQINFIPRWAKISLINLIKKREDWCISRQRYWGFPITIFYNQKNEPIYDEEISEHIFNLFLKHGIEIWYQWSIEQLLDGCQSKKKQECKEKEKDIIDVWFDSSVSWFWLQKDEKVNIDLLIEGKDQLRGWFNGSLLIQNIFSFQNQYKHILSHGFIVDENGQKMSKSIGNVIHPEALIEKYGSDILRLWIININWENEIKVSFKIIEQINQEYLKLRNMIRFILLNLYDFDYQRDYKDSFEEIDLYILTKWKEVKLKINKYYLIYSFQKINEILFNFFIYYLSSFYFDLNKDILYTEKINSLRRRQVQTVLALLIKEFLIIIAPILVHTSEEIFDYLKFNNIFLNQESIHFQVWPESEKLTLSDEKKLQELNLILNLRENINKLFESIKSKIMPNLLYIKVLICLKEESNFFKNKEKFLKNTLVIGDVILFEKKLSNHQDFHEYKNYFLKLEKKDGYKCLRCWKLEANKNEEICLSCHQILINK